MELAVSVRDGVFEHPCSIRVSLILSLVAQDILHVSNCHYTILIPFLTIHFILYKDYKCEIQLSVFTIIEFIFIPTSPRIFGDGEHLKKIFNSVILRV